MNNYICIVTKIKAMQKNLLKDEEYSLLSNLNSMSELVEFFKSHPTYAPYFENANPGTLHRAEIEKRLYAAFNNEFVKIFKFADLKTRKFLKAISFNFVVLFIKKAMHSLFQNEFSHIDQTILHDFFYKHSNFNPNEILEARNITDFIEALKDTEIYENFKYIHETTGNEMIYYETFLDTYMFNKLWNMRFKNLSMDDLRYIKRVYGTTIDLVNISTIYRSKKYYNLHDSSIIPFLIPINYKLTKDDINLMLHSEDLKNCIEAIKSTKYGYISKDLETKNIGSIVSDILKKLQHQSVHQSAFSIASIGSFFYFRQQEILHLISITEGIKYKIGPKEINKYLTKY